MHYFLLLNIMVVSKFFLIYYIRKIMEAKTMTIESLSNKVNETEAQLEQLKQSIATLSDEEKVEKTQALKNTINQTKKDLDDLKKKTTDNILSLKQLENKINKMNYEYEQIVREYKNQLDQFSNEVKTWVWDKKWIKAVFDKEEWKENTWKNILRTAGIWAAVWWWILLLKKIFGKKKNKEWKDSNWDEKSDNWEKKWFWERPFGKFFKWTGIWTWIYYIVHGISTGKWHPRDFFDWEKNTQTAESEKVFSSYYDLYKDDPEKYRQYELLWWNINDMYNNIWNKERNYFWDYSQSMMWEIWNSVENKPEWSENIETKWLVPFSLDNFYGSVWEMLSAWWIRSYIRAKNIEEYKQKIKWFWAERFVKVMVPFLSTFTSFATFWIVDSDTAEQKMDKYFKAIGENAQERQNELDLFFRQYTKVLTYYADKKNALAKKYAKNILQNNWYDGEQWPTEEKDQQEMLEEAINDEDWVNNNLSWTSYNSFVSSSLLWASVILNNEKLWNWELSWTLNDIVADVDENTEDILWWFENNAIKTSEEKLKAGSSLDSTDKAWLTKIAQNVISDMWDTTDKSRLYETFDYVFEMLDLDENDKQLLLEESWLKKCFDETIKNIKELQTKINQNPTAEDVELLKNLVWEYTSMKKELVVALYSFGEAKKDKNAVDYVAAVATWIWTFFSHFWKSMTDVFKWKFSVWWFINVFLWLTVTWGVITLAGKCFDKPRVISAWKIIKKTGLLPATLAWMWLRRLNVWWAVKSRVNSLLKTWTEKNVIKAKNLIQRKILDWVLTPIQVWKIIEKNNSLSWVFYWTRWSNYNETFKNVVLKMFGEDNKEYVDVFVKYYQKTGYKIKYTNEDGVRWLTRLNFKFNVPEDYLKSLKQFDEEILKLWENTSKKSYFEKILKQVKNDGDMEFVVKLVKNNEFKNAINKNNVKTLEKITLRSLKQCESDWNLLKFVKWEITIEALAGKAWKQSVEVLSDTRKVFNETIDRAISKFNELPAENILRKMHVPKLEALKSNTTLIDDEMDAFVKFTTKGFPPEDLPDLVKMFKLETKFWPKQVPLGKHLEYLLKEWKYSDFKSILKNQSNWNLFKGIHKTKIVSNLDAVEKNLLKNVSTHMDDFMKVTVKIIAKIL